MFEALARSIGEVFLAPAKTRIGFQHGRIFAAVNAIRESRIEVHIVTARPLRSPRIRRVEALGPRDFVNHLSLLSPAELDAELTSWLREGYRWGAGEKAAEQP
jgi:hypothetical protein